MDDIKFLADAALLKEIGRRLARRRIDLRLTQAALAEEAGVSKRTIERIEAGYAAQTLSLVRILRVLDLLPGLDQLLPKPGPRPMDLLKLKGKLRRRVRKSDSGRGRAGKSDAGWSWGEDE